MSSIIEGYNYDIFISYRQKDNKHDGWVTKFVDNLKGELEATFKEDVSVYFDENPHDRLQETYDVGKSLEGKLKCAIFIPILSQTYCDPSSYAWQHEFLAFLKMMKNDHYGKDVRLRNGNVACRILPVRIHDLEKEDIELFEKETGSVLRAVDFVFRTATGVSRPLVPGEDNRNDNLNKTFYRDQINKMAHAIKEIIAGMKNETAGEPGKEQRGITVEEAEKQRKTDRGKPVETVKRKLLSTAIVFAMLIVAGIFAYPKIFKRDTLERLRTSGERLSVAVMPFQNMTSDTTWDFWQDLMQDNMINYLSGFRDELTVRQTESINDLIHSGGITNYASITPSLAKSISRKLDADVFVSGSLQHSGTKLRVNARLIDTKTEEILRSFEIDTLYNDEIIFDITDSLSRGITNFLIISVVKKDLPPFREYVVTTGSVKALRYYYKGETARADGDYPAARNWYLKALSIDSNFFYAIRRISLTYQMEGLWDQSKEWVLKYYNKRDQMPRRLMLRACRNYAGFFQTPYEEAKYSRLLIEMDNQDASAYYHLGNSYISLQQYDKAIPEYEKSLELFDKVGLKFESYVYVSFGLAYHETGQYKKEKRLYKKALQDYPDNLGIIRRQAILGLTLGKAKASNEYVDKYLLKRKEARASESLIATNLVSIYSEAGMLDKAEEYCSKALSSEPDNLSLAWFLIDKDRDINKGLEIIDRALKMNPDDWTLLGSKGVGLYKKGQYKEAIELLEKSWSRRRGYFHPFFVTLEAAKEAVAGQNNN